MKYQRYVGPAMIGLAAIAALAVLGVPVVAFLPFLVFLACPLMMIIMMRGMNHGDGGCQGSHQCGNDQADEIADEPSPPERLPQ